jgi:hypothetical protein
MRTGQVKPPPAWLSVLKRRLARVSNQIQQISYANSSETHIEGTPKSAHAHWTGETSSCLAVGAGETPGAGEHPEDVPLKKVESLVEPAVHAALQDLQAQGTHLLPIDLVVLLDSKGFAKFFFVIFSRTFICIIAYYSQSVSTHRRSPPCGQISQPCLESLHCLKNQSSINSIAYCLSSIIILMLSVCYYKPPMLSFINKKKIG